MNSKGHRANILREGYAEIGVGLAVDQTKTPYWTQVFGGISGEGEWKLITFSPNGKTGNTVVRVDGKDILFGSEDGKWVSQKKALGTRSDGTKRSGHLSVWVYNQISITQAVEIVPANAPAKAGEKGRLLEACLISYLIENKDSQPHTVGLRVMVDTLIGKNDGHPFAVPGQKDLITTSAAFRGSKEIPLYVKALEGVDFDSPGVVAYFTLKLGGELEGPEGFVITTWPGEQCGWDVPVRPIGGDAAVAIYWNPRVLNAGQVRDAGYAYGLGIVSMEKGTPSKEETTPPEKKIPPESKPAKGAERDDKLTGNQQKALMAKVKAQTAINLTWISKRQLPDGSWGRVNALPNSHQIASTAFCALALMASGDKAYQRHIDLAAGYVSKNLFANRPLPVPPQYKEQIRQQMVLMRQAQQQALLEFAKSDPKLAATIDKVLAALGDPKADFLAR